MGEFFILFIIFIAIIVISMMLPIGTESLSNDTLSANTISTIQTTNKPKISLHVTFAPVAQERTFSKKTGGIKQDKIVKV